MSYVRIWVHLVFSTKYRDAFLTREIRRKVHQHIITNCKEKKIFLQAVNGYTDHIHCLISLDREHSIARVAQLIKGESSNWINKQRFADSHFSWQDDYFAVSVSESQMPVVARYIQRQEEHHTKRSYTEEVEVFMTKYGFQRVRDNI